MLRLLDGGSSAYLFDMISKAILTAYPLEDLQILLNLEGHICPLGPLSTASQNHPDRST